MPYALRRLPLAAKPAGKRFGVSRRWTSLRKIVQTLAFLAILVLTVAARGARWPAWITNLPLRLDPLVALINLLASRTAVAGMSVALITIGLTLIVGRAWCGWLCPVGTLLDWFPLRRMRVVKQAPPEGLRALKYFLLLAMVFAALFGNLTLAILDPLTIFVRTVSMSVLPLLDEMITWLETAFYAFPPLRAPISTLDGFLRPALLPQTPLAVRGVVLFGGIFLGIIALNVVAERFWCRYLCPLGGMLGVLSKFSVVRRSVDTECVGCALCERVCPMGTIQPEEGYASDPGECTVCMECLDSCRLGTTSFRVNIGMDKWNRYDPGRREALAGMGTALVGTLLLRSGLLPQEKNPGLIRPPGVAEEDMLSRCVRCGECIQTCPTGALQPALTEAGVEGLWTPVVVPRLGFCDYGCNACGQSCPVDAIPSLNLEEKRLQVLGHAHIDRERCIAWAEDVACIVCEEMCPVPQKAITLEEHEVIGIDGFAFTVQRPHVMKDLCIGCGVCEYQCPVEGDAAIRVSAAHTGQQRQRQGRHGGHN
jgi:polyferredoxin